MCFSSGGSGGSTGTKARQSLLTAQRRQGAVETVTGYTDTKGGWGDATSSSRLVELTPPTKPHAKHPMSSADYATQLLTQQKTQAQSANNPSGMMGSVNFAPKGADLLHPSNVSRLPAPKIGAGLLGIQPQTPTYSYTDKTGAKVKAAQAAKPTDGLVRTSEDPTPQIVIQDGKGYFKYTSKSQTYKAGGRVAQMGFESLNRTSTADPAAALKATRKSRALAIQSTQSASILKGKRGGGLRIDSSGVNAASTRSGVNIG